MLGPVTQLCKKASAKKNLIKDTLDMEMNCCEGQNVHLK
jgi:hypothetical protein